MSRIQRGEKFQFRINDEERRMLEAVAENDGLSASDKVRQMIRQEFWTTFGTVPPKRRKR